MATKIIGSFYRIYIMSSGGNSTFDYNSLEQAKFAMSKLRGVASDITIKFQKVDTVYNDSTYKITFISTNLTAEDL